MIREIAAKSSGAQIKIMSSKEAERELQDCVVTIAGSLKNKQDACALIIEQVEAFKLGAPTVPSKPLEREISRGADKSYDREYSKNIDRRYPSKESPERYLGKRQEYNKYEKSRSPERYSRSLSNSRERNKRVKRDDYREKDNYREREEYRQKDEYRPKEDYRSKDDYRVKDEYKAKENYREKDDYREKRDRERTHRKPSFNYNDNNDYGYEQEDRTLNLHYKSKIIRSREEGSNQEFLVLRF